MGDSPGGFRLSASVSSGGLGNSAKAPPGGCPIDTSVGYYAALSPLSSRIIMPRKRILDTSIVIEDEDSNANAQVDISDDEECVITGKRAPMTNSDRQAAYRQRKKAKKEEKKLLDADRDALFHSLVRRGRKKNEYDDANLLFLLRVGTCPSAGGSRASIAQILSSGSATQSPPVAC